jgi:hypothetical protein
MIFLSVNYLELLYDISLNEIKAGFPILRRCSNPDAIAHANILSSMELEQAIFISQLCINNFHPLCFQKYKRAYPEKDFSTLDTSLELLQAHYTKIMFMANDTATRQQVPIPLLRKLILKRFADKTFSSSSQTRYYFDKNESGQHICTELFFGSRGGMIGDFKIWHYLVSDTMNKQTPDKSEGILRAFGICQNDFWPRKDQSLDDFVDDIYITTEWFNEFLLVNCIHEDSE